MTVEQLRRERERLLRDNYMTLMETLAMADGLAGEVRELRGTVQTLGETIVQLETATAYEHVEESIVRPHRERTERLREAVRREQERRQKVLLERAIHLLESSIALPTCLRIVSTLKQQRDFIADPARLPEVFLTARTRYITRVTEEALAEPEGRLFEALAKVMREPVLEVVTQYKAAFADLYPLSRFLLARIDWLLASLRALVGKTKGTLVLATYWNQLVLLNQAYAGIGAAFLRLAEPIFVTHAAALLRSTAQTALQHAQTKLATELKRSPGLAPMSPQSRSSSSAGKDLRPPAELGESPALVFVLNSFVDIFEQMRLFAIPALQRDCKEIIEKHLGETGRLIGARGADPERDLFDTALSPFIDSVLAAYFPPNGDGPAEGCAAPDQAVPVARR